MEFSNYIRKPFSIKALEVTEDNFEEVAALVGKDIQMTSKGDRYIVVNRRIIPNGFKIFLGWWVTVMDDNIRCYPPKSFNAQFEPIGDGVNAFDIEPQPDVNISSEPIFENLTAAFESAADLELDED